MKKILYYNRNKSSEHLQSTYAVSVNILKLHKYEKLGTILLESIIIPILQMRKLGIRVQESDQSHTREPKFKIRQSS